MMRMKISDLYSISDIFDGADLIFTLLKNENNYPDVHDFINDDNYGSLNKDYYISHSNEKYISPLFKKLYDDIGDIGTVGNQLVSIIYNRFSTKWKKLYTALNIAYKPLENYDMEETRTPDLTDSETINTSSEIETSRETSATNSYKGFNSADTVTVNKTDGNENITTSGESEKNEVSKSATHTGTESLTRHGNIGVTTSQQMLESEIKVRQYDFYKQVFKDIDSVLCLSIY